MVVTFQKIKNISDGRVTFYSAKCGNNQLTEFELFDAKDFSDHSEELEILYTVINEMRTRGAKSFYFKPEGPANAIPIVPDEIKEANKKDYGIRLYCIWLTYELVVLLNGGIKTRHNPQDCPNVKPHFEKAKKIARALDKALVNKEINYQDVDSFLYFEIEI